MSRITDRNTLVESLTGAAATVAAAGRATVRAAPAVLVTTTLAVGAVGGVKDMMRPDPGADSHSVAAQTADSPGEFSGPVVTYEDAVASREAAKEASDERFAQQQAENAQESVAMIGMDYPKGEVDQGILETIHGDEEAAVGFLVDHKQAQSETADLPAEQVGQAERAFGDQREALKSSLSGDERNQFEWIIDSDAEGGDKPLGVDTLSEDYEAFYKAAQTDLHAIMAYAKTADEHPFGVAVSVNDWRKIQSQSIATDGPSTYPVIEAGLKQGVFFDVADASEGEAEVIIDEFLADEMNGGSASPQAFFEQRAAEVYTDYDRDVPASLPGIAEAQQVLRTEVAEINQTWDFSEPPTIELASGAS